MKVLAIDPGSEQSAWVLYENNRPVFFAKEGNLSMLAQLRAYVATHYLAIEMIASYGMPVGVEVFETCVWIGRFIQAFAGIHETIYRKDVKMHLCGSMRAKDGNVRQALIDRFGGKAQTKKGGVLHGISGDIWSALAVAVTYADKHASKGAA